MYASASLSVLAMLAAAAVAGCAASSPNEVPSPSMSETSAPPSASATATEVSPGNYTSKQQIYDAMVAAGVCEVGSMTEYGCMDPSIVSVIGIEPQNEGMTCATRSDRKATNFNQIVLGDNWYVISTDFEKVPGLAEAVGGEEVTIDQFCSALGW